MSEEEPKSDEAAEPDDEPRPDDEPEVVDVMLGDVGAKPYNTLMIERSDLIVPLERDFDGDPLQDDEVLLKTADGTLLCRLLSSDDDVTDDPDKGLRFYRFRNLRYGAYHVWIVVGGQEREVLRNLVIRAEGGFVGAKALATTHDKPPLARDPLTGEVADEDDEPDGPSASDEEGGWFPDQEEAQAEDDE